MIWLFGIQLALAVPASQELLIAVDQNLSYQNRSAQIQMTVQTSRRDKIYQLYSVTLNRETAVEFIAPARDKGTKLLKKGDQLWMYLPSIEKVQKISGHMLAQGLMGSSVSYQDIMESTNLQELYEVIEITEIQHNSRACYQVVMQAKSKETAYQKRISWIDQEWMIPHKEEYYALSGKLLKTMIISEHRPLEGRNVPTKITIQDALQPALITTLEFSEISFEAEGKEALFQHRWLER